MKLPKGPLKVIFTDPTATEENEKRARASGTRFRAPFWVACQGVDGNGAALFQAYAVRGHMILRSSLQRFPRTKEFPRLHNLRTWMETTAELVLDLNPPETYPQAPKPAPTPTPRVADASTEDALNGQE